MTVETVESFYSVKVLINDILHLHFRKSKYLGLSSWEDSEHKYVIEISLSNRKLLLEYSDKSLWVEVLEKLNGVLT